MTVRLDIADHVARVTVDRPAVLNALDAAATAALEAVWQQLEADRDVRAVVLTGAGERAFCAGADMRSDAAGADNASTDQGNRDAGKPGRPARNRTGLDYWAHAHPTGFGGLSLRTTLDIPVIARVNGHALGGGLEMMLGCDIVVTVRTRHLGSPNRVSAACRSMAAWCCCRVASGIVPRWECC